MALQISLDLPFVLRNYTGLTLVSIRHYDIYRSCLLRYGIIPDLHSYYNIAPRISPGLPFVLRNHTGLTLTLIRYFEFFGLAFCATESYRAHILIIIWHYRFLRTCPFVLRNHLCATESYRAHILIIWHYGFLRTCPYCATESHRTHINFITALQIFRTCLFTMEKLRYGFVNRLAFYLFRIAVRYGLRPDSHLLLRLFVFINYFYLHCGL